MNFGLTILAVFYIAFLIVPGVFFKKFYFQSKFSKEFNSGNFADKFITSIFWGLITQLIVFFILKTTFEISYVELYKRCKNIYTDIHNNTLPTISPFQLKTLFVIQIFSVILACILGFLLHKFVRIFKLDIKFSPIRFANDWNYIFRAELYENPIDYNERLIKKYYSTEVDVLVNDGNDDKPSFYQGILHDYYLDENGNLDRISLSLARKRIKLENGQLEFRDIVGDTFIVPYKNISNLNLRYNYNYKLKNEVFPPIIRNATIIMIILLFLFLLIAPWFSSVGFFSKIFSIFIFFISWCFLIGAISDVLSDRPLKNPIKLSMRLIFIILFIFSLLGGLDLIEVVKIYDIFNYVRNLRTS